MLAVRVDEEVRISDLARGGEGDTPHVLNGGGSSVGKSVACGVVVGTFGVEDDVETGNVKEGTVDDIVGGTGDE